MDGAPEPLRIGIVGLGLIGGSLALALREAGFARELWAWDAQREALATGSALGVIDRAADSLEELMNTVDLAVLAAPTVACAELLPQMLQQSGSCAVVTDVASVKGTICRSLESLDPHSARFFVPGHPIAGSERSGVGASRGDLFLRHRVILTPLAGTDATAVASVRTMWEAAGAEVSIMDVAQHDAVLAATSHLPHMLAYALVDALAHASHRDDIFRFAAGGFRDFTRIASSDPIMWRDVALTNRGAILGALDTFEDHLGRLRKAIEVGDAKVLEETFRTAKSARDDFARRSALGEPQSTGQGNS
jgi:3-phosphoshikimate 1-carboxyvinyltransferase